MNSLALRVAVIAWMVLAGECAWSQQSIAISTLQYLSFGRFAAGAGGTVTVSASGVRSAGPGIVLLSSGIASEARYAVSGDPHAVFSITLPDDGDVSLADGDGHSMPLRLFSAQSQELTQLGAGGTQTLAIGAALSAAAGQPAGSYTGNFSIYVEYN